MTLTLPNHRSGSVSDMAIVVNVFSSGLCGRGTLGNQVPLVYSQFVFVPNEPFVGSIHSSGDDTRELQKQLELLGQLAVVGPVHLGEKVSGRAKDGSLDSSDGRARENLFDGSFDLAGFVVGRNGFSGRHDGRRVVREAMGDKEGYSRLRKPFQTTLTKGVCSQRRCAAAAAENGAGPVSILDSWLGGSNLIGP